MQRKRAIYFIIGVIILAIAFSSSCATYAQTGKTLFVGVPKDRCPIFYENPDNGKIEGIGVDLIKLVGQEAGFRIKVAFIKEQSLADALDNPKYDILIPFGSAIKSSSGKQSIVSDPIFSTPFTFVTLKNKSLSKPEDMKVGMPASVSGVAQTLKGLYPKMEIQLFEDMNACVKALRDNQVDALLHNSYVWSYVLQKPSYHDLEAKPAEAFAMPFCVGTINSKKGQAIIDRISEANQHILDSQRTAITLDYTSRHLYRETIWDQIYLNYKRMIAMGIVVVLFLIGFLFWWRQRKQYICALEETNGKLAKADEARLAFLSSMSHEMRTPLNGIIGFLGFAAESENQEEMRNYLEKARSSADIMLNLVNDVLDLSKIASAKMQLQPENFDAYELFHQIINSVQPQANAHNITFTSGHKGQMPRIVYADRLRVQQVVLNLLSNAVKYTPDGGEVSFFLERTEPDEDGYDTIISIKDNGIGMSQEFQKRMFEPFAQEHSSRIIGAQGTGLGLSIVKQMVELMHGRIEVHSVLDQGTEFILHLSIPKADLKEETSQKDVLDARNAELAILKGKRALLTDDNKMNLEIAATLLRERMKMEVDCASDGKMALEMFADSAVGYYDVILMDIRMPVMNGVEATKSIRALNRKDAQSIPIIAMTADSFNEDIERCLNAGLNAHVAKPIIPDKLMHTLSEML